MASMPQTLIQDYAAQHLPSIQQEIKTFLAQKKTEAKEISPHLLQSLENLDNFIFRGGKFMRSLLVVAGYRLAGGAGTEVYKVAAAAELFHKYIMSVDDMADRDEMRYGGPTLWKKYQDDFEQLGWTDPAHHGRTFSEIDGLVLSSFTTELVRTADFPADVLLKVLGIIDNIMYWRTIGGWQIHYFQNQQPLAQASEEEYIKGLEMVTAEYSFIAPLQIGATLAREEANGPLMKMLTEYGRAVGQAFQMQDDILGMFGNTEETGKPVGNDLREGKKTLLIQGAYHSPLLTEDEKKNIAQACGNEISPAKIKKIQELMIKSGSLEESQKRAETFIAEAQKLLSVYQDKSAQRLPEIDLLLAVSEFVLQRKA
jgi:geranylgeranyl diphosphate synthase, type I